MNVALVILHADPARGGAERYTHDLAAGLVGRGHRVAVLASSFADVPDGVTAVPLTTSGRTRVGRYEQFLDAVDGQFAAGAYDVVHAMLPVRRCDVYHPHAGVAADAVAAGGLAGRLNRRRVRFAAVERRLLTGPQPPVVLCLSGLVRSAVRRSYPGLAEDRLAMLFNGTDLTRFNPAATPDPGPAVRAGLGLGRDAVVGLMLAQDFERKGLRQAVAAVAAVSGWHLVVGGRDDPAGYRRQAAGLGVADRVHFAGPVTDPAAFYRAADFFVLPTRRDPCSLVVLEALSMGLPVISTAQNGACEAMRDGTHGRVLPTPDDSVTLAAAVSDLLRPHRRGAMAAACLTLRSELSQARHLTTVEQTYVGLQHCDRLGSVPPQ